MIDGAKSGMKHIHVFCMFCDDIREETSGKTTVVGWHSGPILNVPAAPPLVLPKLGLLIHILCPVDQPFSKLALEMRWGDNVLQRIEPPWDAIRAGVDKAALEADPDARTLMMNFALTLVPFVADKPATLRAHVFLDGEEYAANGLKFAFATEPSRTVESQTVRSAA